MWLYCATFLTRENAVLPVLFYCMAFLALPVIGLGAWLALGRRRWLAGGATALGALTLLVVDVRWVIPHFRHEPYVHLWRYRHLGHSLGEIILTTVTHPLRTISGLLTGGRLVYLIAMLAPLALSPGQAVTACVFLTLYLPCLASASVLAASCSPGGAISKPTPSSRATPESR